MIQRLRVHESPARPTQQSKTQSSEHPEAVEARVRLGYATNGTVGNHNALHVLCVMASSHCTALNAAGVLHRDLILCHNDNAHGCAQICCKGAKLYWTVLFGATPLHTTQQGHLCCHRMQVSMSLYNKHPTDITINIINMYTTHESPGTHL